MYNVIEQVDEIIRKAFAEDIGPDDITTRATVPLGLRAQGKFLVKQNGVVVGFDLIERCFLLYDSEIKFKKLAADGDSVLSGTIAAEVEGKASSILTVERTALNFFQRMSGIATAVHTYQDKIKHTKAKIIDTRKTAPGLRAIDKLAVRLCGGVNHRIGLYDMFLIKDNHITAAGSITRAVEACRKLLAERSSSFKVEVETKNIEEVKEALSLNVDIIMLDNFNIDDMRKAVKLINGKCKAEASGMVDLDSVKDIAETGVDYVSVGAVTHSVKALDISLKISPLN